MEYFLQLTDSAKMIFGSKDKTLKKHGFVEYFDKANPVGLLKAHFSIIATSFKASSNIELISEYNKPITDEDAKKAVITFEKIEQQVVARGILPASVVVTGIYFFNNPDAGFIQQVIRYYVYPKKPRNYSLTVGGRHVMLYHENNVIPPEKLEPVPATTTTGEAQPATQKHNHNNQNKGNKHKKQHPNQKPKDFDQTKAGNSGLNDKVIDKVFNGNVDNSLPIADEDIADALEAIDKEDDIINFSTDTGISEPFSEQQYTEVLDREEAADIESLLESAPPLVVTEVEAPADSGSDIPQVEAEKSGDQSEVLADAVA